MWIDSNENGYSNDETPKKKRRPGKMRQDIIAELEGEDDVGSEEDNIEEKNKNVESLDSKEVDNNQRTDTYNPNWVFIGTCSVCVAFSFCRKC